MKPIHGTPTPLWKRLGLQEFPPIQCDLKVGDRVIFKNEAGLRFHREVAGFAEDTKFYGRFIHLVSPGSNGEGNAWWFPHTPAEITKAD